jgi:two-component system phosphate regulon sensor histidine kinase PhoR
MMNKPPATAIFTLSAQDKQPKRGQMTRPIPAFVLTDPLQEPACRTRKQLRRACEKAMAAYWKEVEAHGQTAELLGAEMERSGMLEEKLAGMGLLIAGMVHDMKTPLTVAVGAAELLMVIAPPDKTFLVTMLENSHANLRRTIDLVLDFFQIEAGKVNVKPKVIDIGTEAAALAEAMRPMAKDRTLEISPGAGVYAMVDPRLFGHVVENLVANAIKYNNNGGKVTVSATVNGGRAVLSVSDTGPGIAGEDLPHIFDPYERGAASGKGDGRGLGLAVVSSLTELMGGTIEVRSKVGSGSTFSVSFPLAEAPAKSENAQA